jgi:hypothetical protein
MQTNGQAVLSVFIPRDVRHDYNVIHLVSSSEPEQQQTPAPQVSCQPKPESAF